MKNILLPTDFSENAWNAISYALKLYKDEESRFHIYNAYTPVIYHVEYVLINPAQYGLGDAVRDTAQKNLYKTQMRIEEEFGNNPKHSFDTIARFDTLILGIKAIAIERNIEVILMGTKGASGIKEVLFGSNTVHVFKNIKLPIIAIPDGFEFEKPHEILFPTDYQVEYKAHHLEELKNLAQGHGARINILHVSYGYDLTESQKKHKRILEKSFDKTVHLFHEVRNENVQDAINHFQMKAKINLLAMINNKHSFFENLLFKSKIKQIGFHLNVPFLVIPSQYKKEDHNTGRIPTKSTHN